MHGLALHGCSELSTLCQRLAALAPALAAAMAAAPHRQSPAVVQGTAACFAAKACINIAMHLEIKGSDALRVAVAARLLLLVGREVLVVVADSLRQDPAAQDIQTSLEFLLNSQLHGMQGYMALVQDCERPDAIAVFAATTAPPDALLPWLAAASQALLLACRTCRQGASPVVWMSWHAVPPAKELLRTPA